MLEMQYPNPVELSCGKHLVHFYEDETGLAGMVGGYLAAALSAGDSVVVVATPEHLKRFSLAMTEAGVDPSSAESDGRLILLDAEATLAEVSPGGTIDPERFESVVGNVIRRAARGSRSVRAYGEMVALLWDRGEVNAAVQLERLWNDLAERMAFGLLCAYPLNVMSDGSEPQAFDRVCGLHTDVVGGAPVPFSADSCRRFPASMSAAALARRYVSATLEAWGATAVIDDALIVVSELVANAVRYCKRDFSVALARGDSTLRIVVGDPSPEPPRPGTPGPLSIGGRGLQMVGYLAAAWGYDRLAGGKLVWADLSL